ncbi:MAG: enoyl-CoA hydratase-related protein [Actinomycetota bacterium]
MTALVHFQLDSGVATITLDSPPNRNALSPQLVAELLEALDHAEQASARAVALTHTGPVFSAGMDLTARLADPELNVPFAALIERVMTFNAPTIAAVHGSVRAGGIGLMAACDLVVAHSSVTFAFTEVRLGLAPAVISIPVLSRCAWPSLAGPFLTGETFDAAAACRMGLVSHVNDDVTMVVDDLLRGVLAGAPNALAVTKQLLRGGRRSFADMQRLSDELFRSAEGTEGMRSFAEKRPPAWQQ